jgi:predicted DNA-binding protein (MmcQ/YjbR family)
MERIIRVKVLDLGVEASPVWGRGFAPSTRHDIISPMPDVDSIRAFCRSFPDVNEDMPWEDELCFKVRGKIFVGMALSDGRYPRITLKASPENFESLLEIEGIAPAAYVGRYKWVTLANCNVVRAAELEDLIRQSYELVSTNAPKKTAPKKKSRENRRFKSAKDETGKNDEEEIAAESPDDPITR